MKTQQISLRTVNMDGDLFTHEPVKNIRNYKGIQQKIQQKYLQIAKEKIKGRSSQEKGRAKTFYISTDHTKNKSLIRFRGNTICVKEIIGEGNHSQYSPAQQYRQQTQADKKRHYAYELGIRFQTPENSHRQSNSRGQGQFAITARQHRANLSHRQVKNTICEQPQLDPYRHKQYIYKKNQKEDEMFQTLKSNKNRIISSITKSYRVTSINLAPSPNKKQLLSLSRTIEVAQKKAEPETANSLVLPTHRQHISIRKIRQRPFVNKQTISVSIQRQKKDAYADMQPHSPSPWDTKVQNSSHIFS